MCDFHINRAEILRDFPVAPERLDALLANAAHAFPRMVELDDTGLSICDQGHPLTRMVARMFDAYDQSKAKHSAAV